MSTRELTGADLGRALSNFTNGEPVRRVDMNRAMEGFARDSSGKRHALGNAAEAINTAVHGGGRFWSSITETEFAVLAGLVDYLRPEFAVSEFHADPEPADKQLSHDGYGVQDGCKL